MIKSAEYIFICLLAIWMSSLEKCLFRSSVHSLVGPFGSFLLLSCMSSLYTWILALYQIPDLQIFSPIQKVFFLFIFFDGFLCYTEAFLFVVVPLVYFGFCCFWLCCQVLKTYL